MADTIDIGGIGLQTVYGEESKIGASGLQLVYGASPDYGIGFAGIQVVYADLPPYRRVFPVPPANRVLQSQADKRLFPVLT